MARRRYLYPEESTSETPFKKVKPRALFRPLYPPLSHMYLFVIYRPTRSLYSTFLKKNQKNSNFNSQTLLGCGNSEPFNTELCATALFRAQMLTPHACLGSVSHPHYDLIYLRDRQSMITSNPLTAWGMPFWIQNLLKSLLKVDDFLKKKCQKNFLKSSHFLTSSTRLTLHFCRHPPVSSSWLFIRNPSPGLLRNAQQALWP